MKNFFLTRFARLSNSFYVVVILIQLLLIVLTIIFTELTIELLDKNEYEKANSVVVYVKNQLEQATTRAIIATAAVVNDVAVVEAFKERDRGKLIQTCSSIWKSLHPLGFYQFQFHVPTQDKTDYVTFLRMHNPEQYNDSLSNRPTVMKCNATKEIVNGLEQGKSGYSFRSVAPVFSDGNHIGSLEFGFDFGNTFLQILNENYPGNWGIYNLVRGVKSLDDRIVLNAIGPAKDTFFENLMPDDIILNKINKGKTYYEKNRDSQTISLFMPIKNFQGDIVLILKYVYPTVYYQKINSIIKNSAIICGIGLLLSGVIIFILYRMITIPIRKLVGETDKIKNFQLDEEVHISSSLAEMRELIEATKSMKAGLQSFRKYVPAQLVRQLIQTKQEAKISGQRKNLTVLFSDVADFTTISEGLTPNELASQLSEYFNEITTIIIKYNGTVDKYIGDAIMAFWGAPIEIKDHAVQACLAALECQKKVRELAVKWQNEGRLPFKTRIGINTGEIIVGNIGSEQRLNYTVIGDAVNIASRLEGLNKEYGTRIIISQNTFELLPDDFAVRMLDFAIVKGKTEIITIYELVAEKGDVTSIDLEFLKYFNQAITAYKNREWDTAIKRFKKILVQKPDDFACQIFIDRCEQFKVSPPPEEWSGEYVYHNK